MIRHSEIWKDKGLLAGDDLAGMGISSTGKEMRVGANQIYKNTNFYNSFRSSFLNPQVLLKKTNS